MSANQATGESGQGENAGSSGGPPRDKKEGDEAIYAMAQAKHDADIHRQIAKLRSKGMKHRNKASKFLLKSKKAEKRAAVMLQKANQLRNEAAAILEQAKTKGRAAADMKNGTQPQPNGQNNNDDREIRIARLEHDEARLQKQANSYLAKAASLTEKATRLKQKSISYLQKQRSHEVDSSHYMKRAEDIERSR
ncbi:MAG: hypothetical protein KIY12_00570 [Thermoplasmata archaeon]|uniref:Uncharacterized protein n=1 Tax=Candidatus Sysuiplasma superficiale TaxID=2823368 RepID=A0A8J8CAF7_9ARCH|nr:hypothetical protein [Candidatus Sysuiplasma superficiale]MBX8643218.1 hypothetical protein [Candidatus Sysuiplasma superficiale]MCL4346632.1 hypothetical protein [Candidatus Thermoplasmatota archaeon]MCL5437536.1 hypothetical protein [Candidatus Thermoplasmatota archaeon]